MEASYPFSFELFLNTEGFSHIFFPHFFIFVKMHHTTIVGHSIVKSLAKNVTLPNSVPRLSLDLKVQGTSTLDWVGHGGLSVYRLLRQRDAVISFVPGCTFRPIIVFLQIWGHDFALGTSAAELA